MPPTDRYLYYKRVFSGYAMPFALVDLDLFDENVRAIVERAGGVSLCVASKSIRCRALLERIMAASDEFRAIMSYSAREAVFLANHGFDNILVAYPVWSEVSGDAASVAQASRLQAPPVCSEVSEDVASALKAGKSITFMVDCDEHIAFWESFGEQNDMSVPVCMDIDMSSRFPGIYFGVRRSPITTPDRALALWKTIRNSPHVRLAGVMGYEAQIAGVQDRQPGRFLKNTLIRFLKRRSIREVIHRRAAIVNALENAGAQLEFVNGGGTGSVEFTRTDTVVTEVTAGSGFFSPALFDHYSQFKHQPAAAYAIEVVRKPAPGIFTCQGGGYVASGAAGRDKLPVPYLPEGARLIDQEGAGEVQTPIVYRGGHEPSIGDPVFMRHAKAGELCERFDKLYLVKEGKVVDTVPTYRGEAACFI